MIVSKLKMQGIPKCWVKVLGGRGGQGSEQWGMEEASLHNALMVGPDWVVALIDGWSLHWKNVLIHLIVKWCLAWSLIHPYKKLWLENIPMKPANTVLYSKYFL